VKRLALLAAALASAALATSALGETTSWFGNTTGGDPVNFQVKDPPHGHESVRHFIFGEGIELVCDEAAVMGFKDEIGTMRVRHKHFEARKDRGSYIVKVAGDFKDPSFATGTVRVKGNWAGYHHCDTGVLSWSASDL
jgi:hypothetical protein